MRVLELVSLVIGIIGVAVIIWGVLIGTIEFVLIEYQRFRRKNICKRRENLRHHIGIPSTWSRDSNRRGCHTHRFQANIKGSSDIGFNRSYTDCVEFFPE
jgi:hypothetical protein